MKFQGKEVTIYGVFAEQKAVSYGEQNLTAEEQEQARSNIGIDGSGSGIELDTTLSQAGMAADAGAVGKVLAEAGQALQTLATKSLPAVTTADNDKLLMVVGGKWQATSIPMDAIVQAVVAALPEWTGGAY